VDSFHVRGLDCGDGAAYLGVHVDWGARGFGRADLGEPSSARGFGRGRHESCASLARTMLQGQRGEGVEGERGRGKIMVHRWSTFESYRVYIYAVCNGSLGLPIGMGSPSQVVVTRVVTWGQWGAWSHGKPQPSSGHARLWGTFMHV
jgi:hypothetical protein